MRKQKVSRAYQNAKDEVNTQLNCNLSTRNIKRKNVDIYHRTRSSTLPLAKSLKDKLHHGISQNGNIGRNPPSGHTRDKANQTHHQSHSAKYKIFASRFLTRTGIGLSEDSSVLAFRCWGDNLRLFDVQGVRGLTSLWMVDEGRRWSVSELRFPKRICFIFR